MHIGLFTFCAMFSVRCLPLQTAGDLEAIRDVDLSKLDASAMDVAGDDDSDDEVADDEDEDDSDDDR